MYNFSLLPGEDFARELVAASRAIERVQALEYRLGDRSLPHVTILQFPGEAGDAETIWSKLSSLEVPRITLRFSHLGFDRFRDLDVVWLRLKHCPELRDLQARAIRTLGSRPYVNGTGDRYEPHATLAAWRKADHLPPLPVPTEIFDREDPGAVAALGRSGPQFQFEECLFRREC